MSIPLPADYQSPPNSTESIVSQPLSNYPNSQAVQLTNGRSLGGGIKGFIAKSVQTNDNNSDFSLTRFLLKQGWNTSYPSQLNYSQPICTPFRAVTNSGDLLSRPAYSCGGPCQTFQSRPGMFGLRGAFGHIADNCDGTGIPPSSCNVKYVYDSSNYTRYMKEKAINKLYNDLSYGGDDSHTNQSAIKAIRRY